jgi:transcriptional regulator with XRE-family HTH domain
LKSPSLKRLLAHIRKLRERQGYTQERFAEKAGFSYKYYQALEAGRKRNLRLSTVDRLASAYGIEAYQLLGPHLPRASRKKKRKKG